MPENLSFYQCFTAQPEGNAPPPSQSRKAQLLSLFYRATRGERAPAAQSVPEISAFVNVLPRNQGGVAAAKSKPENLNLYQCFLAACAFSAAWSIVAQIVHPGEI